MITNALKRSDGNINYPGIIAAWSAKGKTNDDKDRAILKDLTGNGHDITLNNFAFSEMSGYEGYLYNWLGRGYANNTDKGYGFYKTSTKLIITNCNTTKRSPLFRHILNKDKHRVYVKVSGLTEETDLYFGKVDELRYCKKLHNGINDFIVDFMPEIGSWGGFGFYSFLGECNITIEQIPLYPDALVFDGIDDYGSAVDFGGKKIKTVISKYQTINSTGNRFSIYFRDPLDGNNYRRIYTKQIENYPSIRAYSDNVKLLESYVSLQVGSGNPAAKPFQITGHKGNKEIEAMAFYSAYLFDRSLDEQEIKAFIRKYIDPEYLLPSEIPTPDCYYDFSKGSNDDETRDTIKDYSGNGNDAVAHNFAWSGMSGYGGNLYGNYKYHFDTLGKYQSIILDAPIIGNLKFKVTGLTDYFNKTTNYIELRLIRVSDGGADYKEIKEDGEYNIELPTSKYSTISIRSGGVNIEDGTCNIDIEMLPEYEGALVFDGTNDYVSLDAFDSGFKTMFMKFKPINTINAGYYDQIKKGESKYYFSVSGNSSDIAFSYRNTNGKTYINGILNTSILSKDVVNKTVCIGIVNENVTADNTTIPKIGDGTHFTPWFANMALYKFLGFKEALTEEQIQAVIKKYNLLDGVDEIEVS